MKKLTAILAALCLIIAAAVSVSALTLDTPEEASEIGFAEEGSGIPLASEDGHLTASAEWIRASGTNGTYNTVTVTADETVSAWNVDTGNTLAAVQTTDTTATVTAAGYPGHVTVSAVIDGTQSSVTVRLVGRDAGAFLPGVDLITGTLEGQTFDYTAAEYALQGATGSNVTIETDEDGNKFARMRWVTGGDSQQYPIYEIANFPNTAIDKRPVMISMKHRGKKDNLWVLSLNTEDTSSGNVNMRDSFPNNASVWERSSYQLNKRSTVAKIRMQAGLSEAATPYEFDNLTVTPYYKITYHGFDGEEVSSEYVLPISGIYVPDVSKVSGATGFATAQGGASVPVIKLAHADIDLYPVTETAVTFYADGSTAKVNVPAGSYTVPDIGEVGLAAENFRCWWNGSEYFLPGETIADGASLSGAFFAAVCFEEPLFDPAKGYLVYLFNYENMYNATTAYNTPAYLNKAYAAGTAWRTDGNESLKVITDLDGNNAVQLVNSYGSQYQLFGAGIAYNAATVGGKETVQYDYKFISPLSVYHGGSWWMRMMNTTSGATTDNYYNGTVIRENAATEQGIWYHAYAAQVDTSNQGLKGGIVQHGGLPTTAKAIQYVDNYAMYFYPKNTFVMYSANDPDDYTVVTVEGDTYTFPALDGRHIVAWTSGSNVYLAGKTYSASELQFKALTPYVQDETKPAVLFGFEGDSIIGVTNNSCKYSEVIEDNGATVFHVHSWDKTGKADQRFHIMHPEKYDYKDYALFCMRFRAENLQKVDEASETGYSPVTGNWYAVVYAHWDTQGSYYGAALYQFGSSHYAPSDNGYHVLLKDISSLANKEGYDIGYGFSIDPVNGGDGTRFGHDFYIDYVRLYRKGVMTVTYDTNAPAGATVISEVPADTDRGVGVDYLLTGEQPAVEGYTFVGWAETADATLNETIESIDLVTDTTVYAVWVQNEQYSAPVMQSDVAIKGTGAKNGLRFKSVIRPSVKDNFDEFGFITTREVFLPYDSATDTYDADALTFLFKKNGENTERFATGVAYNEADGTDKIFGDTEDGAIVYTAVLTGIPLANKNENMVVRPYAKFTANERHMTIYGTAVKASLYQSAEAIRTAGGSAYEDNQAYIDEILAD